MFCDSCSVLARLGMAVSLPLLRLGVSPWQAFFVGQLSGFFELIAGGLGALSVLVARAILPAAMAFAAGAMIFLVVEELVPEVHQGDNAGVARVEIAEATRRGVKQNRACAAVSRVASGTLASLGCIVGFIVMMVMDTTL